MDISILPVELFERILNAVWEVSVDQDHKSIKHTADRHPGDIALLYPCCINLALVSKQWRDIIYARRNSGLFWIIPIVIEDQQRLETNLIVCNSGVSRSPGCDIYLVLGSWSGGDHDSDIVATRLAMYGLMKVLQHAERLVGLNLSVYSSSALACLLWMLASMNTAPMLRWLEIFYFGTSLEGLELERIDIFWSKSEVKEPPRLDFLVETCPNLQSFACKYVDPIPIKHIPQGIRDLEYINETNLAWEPLLNQLDGFWTSCPSLNRVDLYFSANHRNISIRLAKGAQCNTKELSLRCNPMQAVSALASFEFPYLRHLKMILRSEEPRISTLEGGHDFLERVLAGHSELMSNTLEEVDIRVVSREYDQAELSYLSSLTRRMKIKRLKIGLDTAGDPIRSLQFLETAAGKTMENLDINCCYPRLPWDNDEWKPMKMPDGFRMDGLKQLTLKIRGSEYLYQFAQTVTAPLLTDLNVLYEQTDDVDDDREASRVLAGLGAKPAPLFTQLVKVDIDVENLSNGDTDRELLWLNHLSSLSSLSLEGIEEDCRHILLLQTLFAQEALPFTRLRHVIFRFKWGTYTSSILPSNVVDLLKSIADYQQGREFQIDVLASNGDVLWESHSSWSGESRHRMLLGGLGSSIGTES
jgi:hypothetical protein